MKTFLSLAGAAIAMLVVWLPVSSEEAPPQQRGGRMSFESLDSNADGSVTLEEFKENFNPPARNGRSPDPTRVFSRWDADGSGSLTAEEFANRPRRQGPPGQQDRSPQ